MDTEMIDSILNISNLFVNANKDLKSVEKELNLRQNTEISREDIMKKVRVS